MTNPYPSFFDDDNCARKNIRIFAKHIFAYSDDIGGFQIPGAQIQNAMIWFPFIDS